MVESNWRTHISPDATPHQVVAAVQGCVASAIAGLGNHGITVQVEIPAAGVIAVKATHNEPVFVAGEVREDLPVRPRAIRWRAAATDADRL